MISYFRWLKTGMRSTYSHTLTKLNNTEPFHSTVFYEADRIRHRKEVAIFLRTYQCISKIILRLLTFPPLLLVFRTLDFLCVWIDNYLQRDFIQTGLFGALVQFLNEIYDAGFIDYANRLKLLMIRVRIYSNCL